MQGYLIRRCLLIIPTLFLVTVIIFLLVRFVPGDAIDVMEANASEYSSITLDREAIAHMLGLDVPIHVQYGKWISGMITRGDLGTSIHTYRPVLNVITERIPITFTLGIMSLLIGVIISIPIGIYSAIRQDTIGDYLFRSLSILMIAVPSFWLATLVMIYPSIWWGWSPPIEVVPFNENPLGYLGTFVLPALILGTSHAGVTMRLTRTMVIEVMRLDYIRTAWAKGLTEGTVILRHAIKNAFIPVITIVGNRIGHLLGGSVIIETIFNLPGMGQLMVQSLNNRDYPLVSGITLILSLFVVIANLIVDISYSWLDPRIRYGR